MAADDRHPRLTKKHKHNETKIQVERQPMKRIQALIAATIITALIGLGMLAIGVDAALNSSSLPGGDNLASLTTIVTTASANTPDDRAQAQIGQLQDLVAQYQNREKQYQARLNELSQRLSQANSQVQQLQGILTELQNRGVIRILSDGTIQVPGGRRRPGDERSGDR